MKTKFNEFINEDMIDDLRDYHVTIDFNMTKDYNKILRSIDGANKMQIDTIDKMIELFIEKHDRVKKDKVSITLYDKYCKSLKNKFRRLKNKFVDDED